MDQEFDVKTSFCSRVLSKILVNFSCSSRRGKDIKIILIQTLLLDNSSLTLTSALREFFSRILDSNLNTGHFYQSFAPVTEKLDKEKVFNFLWQKKDFSYFENINF